MDKLISTTTSIIEKSINPKYAILLGTFILFADSLSAFTKKVAIVDITLGYVQKNISIGELLIFFCLFSLYLSSIIPFIQKVLCFLLDKIHSKFGDYEYEKLGNEVSISNFLKTCAKANNNVAYQIYQFKKNTIKERKVLEIYSLAFLFATLINIVASNYFEHTISRFFIDFFSSDQHTFLISLVGLFLIVLYLPIIFIAYSATQFWVPRDNYISNYGIEELRSDNTKKSHRM